MANEFERINNPDSTPGAVSTGYQLQNTNMVSIRVGEDKSVVTAGAGECVLEISGPVDVNGEIYTCNSAVTFTLVTAGKYYIHLAGSGANLTPTIGTGANTFDPDKNARYTDAGAYRVLNWVIYFDGTNSYVHRLTNPQNDQNDYQDSSSPEEYWITAGGTWTAKRTKYYTIYLTGKGETGGAGGTGGRSEVGSPVRGSYGGRAGSTGIKRILITAGTTWTATISTNVVFTDGVTTLQANGSAGAVSGCDIAITGGYGGYGGNGGAGITDGGGAMSESDSHGGNGESGGASFWGSGGYGGLGGEAISFYVSAAGNNGGAAACYGSGGGNGGGGGYCISGGAGTEVSAGGSGGAGKDGVIRIVG